MKFALLVLACIFSCIPTNIVGFLTPCVVIPHCKSYVVNRPLSLRGSGNSFLESSEETDFTISNYPTTPTPTAPEESMNFARRAMMISAALRGLGPLFESAQSVQAIDMQNAAGVGINSAQKDKKPAPGSAAAQLSVFQVFRILHNVQKQLTGNSA